MFQLVLNLGHALVPGTFICRVHTQVGHDSVSYTHLAPGRASCSGAAFPSGAGRNSPGR